MRDGQFQNRLLILEGEVKVTSLSNILNLGSSKGFRKFKLGFEYPIVATFFFNFHCFQFSSFFFLVAQIQALRFLFFLFSTFY